MLQVAYDPIYKYQLPPGHRFPMEKYELLPEQLLHEGTIDEENFFSPTPLTDEIILQTHDEGYFKKLLSQSLTRKEIRAIGFPLTPMLIERGRVIAGGTLECAHIAVESGVALNIAGGTHHAYADRGGGFCVMNDVAIAAKHLINSGEFDQILIADLDVHQGDGTAHIFRKEPRAFTFSMHGESNYPLRKEQSDLDIGLADGTGDELYLSILSEVFEELLERIKPELVFYLAGVDVLESDELGRLQLTREGCKERDRIVLSQCKQASIPVAVTMAGGYSTQIRDIIDAHANTFRLAQQIFF
ncbi:MAG: histone deacetylase [Saprospiraceae bacterium]|nr:histone deacetylase [Saprospiraceae bacterium]